MAGIDRQYRTAMTSFYAALHGPGSPGGRTDMEEMGRFFGEQMAEFKATMQLLINRAVVIDGGHGGNGQGDSGAGGWQGSVKGTAVRGEPKGLGDWVSDCGIAGVLGRPFGVRPARGIIIELVDLCLCLRSR
jgi:hypothetical protein